MHTRGRLCSIRPLLAAARAVVFVSVFGSLLASCSRPEAYAVNRDAIVFTLTNLHPDANRRLLYSTNYQQGGLIPVCTQVHIDSMNAREMRFTIATTGEQYVYRFERHMRDPLDKHMSKYFGPTCPDLSVLSDADRSGIEAGQVYQGMSKAGVIIAIGYPPEHITPHLEADEWIYWRNRMRRFGVQFTDGLVSGIRD